MLPEDDNGMLVQVPGEYSSRGSKGLPPADTLPDEKRVVEVDTTKLWHGVVRITYQSIKMRHGRSSHWAWIAVHAEKF